MEAGQLHPLRPANAAGGVHQRGRPSGHPPDSNVFDPIRAGTSAGGPVPTMPVAPAARLEVVGGPDPESVDPALRHVLRGVAVYEDVVELDLHVRVQEPVQAGGPVVDLPALDGLVVQVQVA